MADKLYAAEQQILGYHSARKGETWEGLVSAMGLSIEEYNELDNGGMIDYLSKDEKYLILSACR